LGCHRRWAADVSSAEVYTFNAPSLEFF